MGGCGRVTGDVLRGEKRGSGPGQFFYGNIGTSRQAKGKRNWRVRNSEGPTQGSVERFSQGLPISGSLRKSPARGQSRNSKPLKKKTSGDRKKTNRDSSRGKGLQEGQKGGRLKTNTPTKKTIATPLRDPSGSCRRTPFVSGIRGGNTSLDMLSFKELLGDPISAP